MPSTDLSPCPECGGNPEKCCVIDIHHSAETWIKDTATAECKDCGFAVLIKTKRPLVMIREHWNVREASASAIEASCTPRCHECVHRERFDNGKNTVLYLCRSQPYEEDEQFGILTWLDTASFESSHCMDFKKA